MTKIAIVVLADVEGYSDLGRLVSALEMAKECTEARDDLQLIFDGAGVQWVAELSKPDHHLHGLFTGLQAHVTGVCSFCATAFGVQERATACGVTLLDEYEGHPSLRTLVTNGYQIVTF